MSLNSPQAIVGSFDLSLRGIRLKTSDWKADLKKQVDYFNEKGLTTEAKRLDERTNFDIEMIKELGYCSGIENYSRYFDGRTEGSRPFCLLDYFPKELTQLNDLVFLIIFQK